MINIGTVILIGIFFVLLVICVLALSIFTLNKVIKISKECNDRFDNIERLIRSSDQTSKELIQAIYNMNKNIDNAATS